MANDESTDEDGGEAVEAAPRPPKPRRAKAKHAHHGGAWKVAYADFITTMMALFLLLWLLSAADQSSRTAISMFFRDPGIFDNPQGANMLPGSGAAPKTRPAPILEVSGSGGAGQRNTENSIDMEKMARVLHEQVAQTSSQRGTQKMLTMQASKGGLQLQLADTADRDLFEVGSSVLTRDAEKIVKSMASIIAAMDDFSVSVAGHTDSKPPPNLKYNNRDLSADRAQRIMQMMVAGGVPASRFREVSGYGDIYLLDPTNPLAPTNRRVVITLRNFHSDADYQGIPSAQPPPPLQLRGAREGSQSPAEGGAHGAPEGGAAGHGEAGTGTGEPGAGGAGTAGHAPGAAAPAPAMGSGTAGLGDAGTAGHGDAGTAGHAGTTPGQGPRGTPVSPGTPGAEGAGPATRPASEH